MISNIQQKLYRMKLHDQVITVEQAIRLKELGVAQSAYFSYFITTDRDDAPGLNVTNGHCICSHPTPPYIKQVSAFTVAELGQMLPERILHEDDDFFPQMHKGRSGWYIQYQTNKKDVVINGEGEIDRPRGYLFNTYRAEYKMAVSFAGYLILLLESKVITVDDVNKRLNA
jgi:hypothetical protein